MSLTALLDLFQRHRAKETGAWKLGEETHRLVYLEHGDIVFAQSTYPQDRLTFILVERGLLTQDQLDYAMANLKPGLSVGKNLIDLGFITQRVLLDVARMQVERVVCAALATPDLAPKFTAKDLEANIVRLPFETPLLLLNGLLALQDRETVLDLLGALNQVVVLESKRVNELTLPSDLAKLPLLLDGTRTLLELARESGVEPMRLGAFALFLREMGWAKLHELPPLDRVAVDLALSPEPDFVSPALPEAQAELSPSLFASIAAASKPTTNLEHLSEALDDLPDPSATPSFDLPEEASPEPAAEEAWAVESLDGISADEGQAHLQSPAEELSLPIASEVPAVEPPTFEPRIHLPLDQEIQSEGPLPPTFEDAEAPSTGPRFPWVRVLLVVLLAGLAVWLGLHWAQRPRKAPQLPAAEAPKVEAQPEAKPQPTPPQPEVTPLGEPKAEPAPVPATPEAKPQVETKPVAVVPAPVAPKAPEPKALDSRAARLQALRQGNLALALAQGEALVKADPKAFTLRLLIACKEETLKAIPDKFQGDTADLFVLPMAMRAGQGCTQIFCGRFASAREAEEAIAKLPAAFQAKGNRPKVFALSDIPRTQ